MLDQASLIVVTIISVVIALILAAYVITRAVKDHLDIKHGKRPHPQDIQNFHAAAGGTVTFTERDPFGLAPKEQDVWPYAPLTPTGAISTDEQALEQLSNPLPTAEQEREHIKRQQDIDASADRMAQHSGRAGVDNSQEYADRQGATAPRILDHIGDDTTQQDVWFNEQMDLIFDGSVSGKISQEDYLEFITRSAEAKDVYYRTGAVEPIASVIHEFENRGDDYALKPLPKDPIVEAEVDRLIAVAAADTAKPSRASIPDTPPVAERARAKRASRTAPASVSEFMGHNEIAQRGDEARIVPRTMSAGTSVGIRNAEGNPTVCTSTEQFAEEGLVVTVRCKRLSGHKDDHRNVTKGKTRTWPQHAGDGS